MLATSLARFDQPLGKRPQIGGEREISFVGLPARVCVSGDTQAGGKVGAIIGAALGQCAGDGGLAWLLSWLAAFQAGLECAHMGGKSQPVSILLVMFNLTCNGGELLRQCLAASGTVPGECLGHSGLGLLSELGDLRFGLKAC